MAKMAKRKKPARKATRKSPARRKAAQVPVFTLRQLKQADACPAAVEEFKRLFGKAAPLTAATMKKVCLSKYLNLYYVLAYLRKVGAPRAAIDAAQAIELRSARASQKFYSQLRSVPNEAAGPAARKLAKQARVVERQRARAVAARRQADALVVECARRRLRLTAQLRQAAEEWRLRRSLVQSSAAVQPHLGRLAKIAAAHLPGKSLSLSEGEIAES